MEKYRLLLVILVITLLVRSVFIETYFTGDAIDTVGPARNYAESGRAAVYATNDKNVLGIAYVDDGLYFNFAHPPMKTLLYSIWAALLGFSNAAMLLLPIIFGLLTIVFIYLIGKQLYSEKVGLIAALIASLIRYHFYASVIAFGDNFLMFAAAAAIYFFYMFLSTRKNIYAIPFAIFMILGFLTKLSAVTIIPVLLIMALLSKKTKTGALTGALIAVVALVLSILAVYFSYPITEQLTGVPNKDFNFFESYVKTFFAARTGYQDLAYEKIFYTTSFAWQFTPFFFMLILLALIKLKRDKSYTILSSWLIITFLIGFASSGQDFQRLMVIAITPAIILVSKYLSNIRWKEDKIYIFLGGSVAVLLAVLTELNDMLPYYEPTTIGLFFLLAVAFIFIPKNKQFLIGSSVGLSIFFLVGTNFLIPINSSAVSQLTHAVQERGYPYKDLWTERDISLYLAPDGEPSFLQRPDLSEEFIKDNNVRYIAFYSIYKEHDIINVSRLCEDEPFFAVVNGRKVGLTCKIDRNKL